MELARAARLPWAGRIHAPRSPMSTMPVKIGSRMKTQSSEKRVRVKGTKNIVPKDVIQSNINSLGVALQNITDAKSQIADTDFATTTAQLTQSQILSQAGISVLQIANQAPSQVLKLLG